MSGSTGKIAPEINLDEFERRLRSTEAAASGAEDPLAELTQLLEMINWDEPARGPSAQRSAAGAGRGGANVIDRAPVVDLGAAEPPPLSAGQAPPTAPSAPTADAPDVSEEPHAATLAAVEQADGAKGRPRSWWIKTVGLTAVGVALLAGAATLKTGVPGLPKGPPPLIAAAQGPNKVQPPSDATVQATGDAAALLMKDSATPTPVKVVSTEEEPIDLAAQTPTANPQAAAIVAPPASPAPSTAAAATPAPAASPLAAPSPSAPSPVAPSVNPPIVAPGGPVATVAPLFPDAKPVKTVSVRPDGTLISVDSTPTPAPALAAPATPAAINPPPAEPAAGEAATPKVDLPTKMPPKSAARVVAKTDTTAPAAATNATPSAPLILGSAPPRASKPAKPAPAAATDATPSAPLTLGSAPPRASKPAKPAPVVAEAEAAAPAPAAPAAAPATEPTAAIGGWSVQLGAPSSEADAKSAIARLKSKYAAALGDVDLAARQTEVKGETIYRVRAEGLTKADATAICAKLKASGGDCFVARD